MSDEETPAEEPKKPAKKTAAKKTAAKKPSTPEELLSKKDQPVDTPAQRKRKKAANKAADEQADEIDQTTTDKDDLPDEREEWFRAPGLQRMKLEFSRDDRAVMNRIEELINARLFDVFKDAFAVMSDIYDVVRLPEEVPGPGGELFPKRDNNGFVVWKRDPITGAYVEDWSRLTTKERENFVFRITTTMFEWEQRKEALWTEAMFSKAIFTERFAIEYDAPMSGTIDDRNAVGNVKAAEDRYFALMKTSVSRRADSVVRTLNNLALRLKETLD